MWQCFLHFHQKENDQMKRKTLPPSTRLHLINRHAASIQISTSVVGVCGNFSPLISSFQSILCFNGGL